MREDRSFCDALHHYESKSEVALSIEYKQISFISDFFIFKSLVSY